MLNRSIILLLDGAGWHTQPGLCVPEGLRVVCLPPYKPEFQSAKHLSHLVEEPIVNWPVDQVTEIQHEAPLPGPTDDCRTHTLPDNSKLPDCGISTRCCITQSINPAKFSRCVRG